MTAWLSSLISEEMVLFVDLWDGQRGLWDPADKDYKNNGGRGKAIASIPEALGREWTIGEC